MTASTRWFRLILLIFSCLLVLNTDSFAARPQIRISAWYWLNSAPKVDWKGDFITMRNMGFTDVVLCWGVDAAAFATRIDDSHYAMKMAQKAGLGAYVLLWHPYGNSLDRNPKFTQVDSAGHQLPTFDVFNPEWRNTEWKKYVQTVAREYGHEPSMSGYVFDDSFQVSGTGIVSYGDYERRKFGHDLPRKPSDSFWKEWTDIRAQWWNDWAKDTVSFIRAIDPDRQHLIYLEDIAGQVLKRDLQETVGVNFKQVSRYFDAVGGYTFSYWDGSVDSDRKMVEQTNKALADLRRELGPDQRIVYTFWSANNDKKEPGPAPYPTAEEIQQICEAALAAGIRYLDMYGFRIGEAGVKLEDFKDKAPGAGPTYPLTGQLREMFLWDRPEILDPLGKYLRSLNQQPSRREHIH
jgi:hypothetical protein